MFEELVGFLRSPWGNHVLFVLVILYPMTRIVARAGFHRALGLLVVVPFIGTVLVFGTLAVRPWPASAAGEKAARR